MSWPLLLALWLLCWGVAATLVGAALGQAIRLADRRQPRPAATGCGGRESCEVQCCLDEERAA